MAASLPNGSVVSAATAYGSSVNMTAITNATEAVATMGAGHGFAVNDILEVTTSGWDVLANRLVRVKTVATNDITFEGINTTNTSIYPAAGGAGTVRKITTWTPITQVKELDIQGGEQQFADATPLASLQAVNKPTEKSAQSIVLGVMDDPSLSWYATVEGVELSGANMGLRIAALNGNKTYANGTWSKASMPRLSRNNVNLIDVTVALAATATRYAT